MPERKSLSQPHLVMGDLLPHHATRPMTTSCSAMEWLELMALHLAFLKRNDNWVKLFERFLGRTRSGWYLASAQGNVGRQEQQPVRLADVIRSRIRWPATSGGPTSPSDWGLIARISGQNRSKPFETAVRKKQRARLDTTG